MQIWVVTFGMVLTLLLPGVGYAQEIRGRLVGVVRDISEAVLPGVTVTAASPALIQPRATTSGADGAYQFPALPPGVYSLTFELPGFQSFRREGIQLGLNTTLTIDAKLALGSVTETVTVSGDSPAVDIKSTTIGTNLTKELLTDIPNARDIWAALAQAPGFHMTGYDVGGSHAGNQTEYVTYGISNQHTTRIEGINATQETGRSAGYFDFGSFEEFQVSASGNMAEQDVPGALLNIIVKSGGDDLHGTAYSDYENKRLVSENVPGALKTPGGAIAGGFKAPSTGVSRGNPIDHQYDLNYSLGGPIKRARAWFFGSYRLNNQYKTIFGLPDLAQSKLQNVTIKSTVQVSPHNQLIGFFNRRTKLEPLRDLSLLIPVSAAYYQDSGVTPMKLEWTRILSPRAFLDVQVSDWLFSFPARPTSANLGPGRIDLATNQFMNGGARDRYSDLKRVKPQLSGNLSHTVNDWMGTHNFKFGGESRWEEASNAFDQPGNVFYRDRGPLPVEIDFYNTPVKTINRVTTVSGYAQDNWVLGAVSLNLGFRYDRYRAGWPAQSYSPNRSDFFAPTNVGEATVYQSNTIAPRLGVAYNPGRHGKTALKAFYGRFYFNVSPDTAAGLENPVGPARLRYEFKDLYGNGLYKGPEQLGRLLSTLGGAGFVKVDRGLKAPYSDELSAHLEQEILEGLSGRASFVYKNIRRDWAEVDLSRVDAYTIPIDVIDPGPANVAGGVQALHLVDRPKNVPENRVFTNPSGNTADYRTVEFALNRRFRNNWLLLTSFEYTRSQDFRDVDSATNPLTAAGHETRYLWRPNQRRFDRQGSSRWNYKLIGRYVFPWDVGLSGSYKLQSGNNWARSLSVRLAGAGSETVSVEPISANRAPSVQIMDLRLEKGCALGGRRGRLVVLFDVFNLFNANPVTNFRITTGPRFGEIIALLDPRIIRLGIRYEF